MERRQIQNFIDATKTKIAPQSNLCIHVTGKNFKHIRSHLNQPYDTILHTLLNKTMQEIAPQIDGCYFSYLVGDDIVFVCHNEEYQTLFMNGDTQKITSLISSMFSVNFYRLFLAFNVEYEDKISDEEYKPAEIIEINNRLQDLWSALSEIPVFYTEVFTLPDNEEMAFIEKLQEDNINKTINQMSRLYMEKTEGLSNKTILKILDKKGHSWYEMPKEYRFGSGYLRRVIEGKNIWTENDFVGEIASKYIK